MEQCSPYGLFYYDEEEVAGMVELRSFLVQTMGLEAAILSAQEEIARKEEEITNIRDLLMVAIKERDQAHHESQKLLLHNLSLQRQIQQHQEQQKAAADDNANNLSSVPDKLPPKSSLLPIVDPANHNSNTTTANCSSSDNEDSSTTLSDQPPQLNSHSLPAPAALLLPTSSASTVPPQIITTLGKQRPLPAKGKLLQAVMEAGPLLQTLMLAGPLPQWQHPPPQLDTIDIPPVTIPSSSNNSSLQHSPLSPNSPSTPSPKSSTLIKQKTALLVHQDSFNANRKRALVENFDGSSSSSINNNNNNISSPSPSSCSKLQRVV